MPSSTVKQAKVMSALAHGWHPDKGSVAKIPVKVAEDFHKADAGHKYGKGMHHKKGDKEKVDKALHTARKYAKKAGGGKTKTPFVHKTEGFVPSPNIEDRRGEWQDRFHDSLYFPPEPIAQQVSGYAQQPLVENTPLANELGATTLYTPTGFADGGDVDNTPDPFASEKFMPDAAKDWTQQAAPKDYQIVQGAGNVLAHTADLPRQMLEGSAQDVQHLGEQGYNPQSVAPATEAAMDIMGASFAGAAPQIGRKAATLGMGAGWTTEGAKNIDKINDAVLGASSYPLEAHPAGGVLAKNLKSFYNKDIAQSAYYLGLSPEDINNNLKSYMTQGAIKGFDEHYAKLMPKAKPAEAAEAVPAHPEEWNPGDDVNAFGEEHTGPGGADDIPPVEPQATGFESALKNSIYQKYEHAGGPWKEPAKGPAAKDLVKHLDEDSTHGTIINALAQQHVMDSPIPMWGLEGQKLQSILKKTDPDLLMKAMSNFHLDENHINNILSYLPEDKIDAMKQTMAPYLQQHGYTVPGATGKTDLQIIQDHLKPINWMEYKAPRGVMPSSVNWGKNDPEALKALGVNPNVILYKGGKEGKGNYPREIFDPAKDKAHSGEAAFFAADDPAIASNYGPVGGHYVARPSKVFEVDYGALAKQLGHGVDPESGAGYYGGLVSKILKQAHPHKPDLVIMHNMHDYGGSQTQYAFMNTHVLRAPHANFDPNKLHLRYPLAGLAGGGLFAYGAMGNEGQENGMADGGKVKHKQIDENPQEHEFINFSKGGLIDSDIPGRTDKIPMKVPPGSYVLPADIPSALGQGNTKAGSEVLKKMFTSGPYGLAPPKVHGQQFHFPSHFSIQLPHHKARGGKVEEEPVKKSKTKVHYGEADTASRRCGTCKYAYGPTGQRHCWLVEGMIKPDDVCNLWEGGIERKAEGGRTDHVPIITAGGEWIIHPDVVKHLGEGDMKQGHKTLDKFVMHTRKQHIKTLKGLKGPK